MPARARARILIRAAALPADRIGEYARMETQQIGRPLREMRAQLARLPEWLEYFGALAQTLEGTSPDFGADHLNAVRRVPLGVVGLIMPWNHASASSGSTTTASTRPHRGAVSRTVGSAPRKVSRHFRAYTQQQSLIINTSRGDFDWFGTVADLRYS